MYRIRHKITGQIADTVYRAKKYAVAAVQQHQARHGDVFEIVREKRDHRYDRQETPAQHGWDRINRVRTYKEDAAAVAVNNIGSGHIEGAGIGPKGEPGINKTIKNKKRKLRDIISRT